MDYQVEAENRCMEVAMAHAIKHKHDSEAKVLGL
jgi:hypothetical protein